MRRAWNGLAALSLLLCVAAVTAWPVSRLRSARSGVYWTRPPDEAGDTHRWWVNVSAGDGLGYLAAGRNSFAGAGPKGPGRGLETELNLSGPPGYPGPPTAQKSAFAADALSGVVLGISYRFGYAVAPQWAWGLAFALLPGWRALRWYRRRRRRGGPAFEVVTREVWRRHGSRVQSRSADRSRLSWSSPMIVSTSTQLAASQHTDPSGRWTL